MKATILDTVTGLTAEVADVPTFQWTENNYSCDCNRNPWHVETGKPEGICEGCERFVVIKAESDHEDDYLCTLVEMNECYPTELLKKHGVI